MRKAKKKVRKVRKTVVWIKMLIVSTTRPGTFFNEIDRIAKKYDKKYAIRFDYEDTED